MSEFEKCLFPGMSSDQYRVLWVEHRDKVNEETGESRLELNFLSQMLKSTVVSVCSHSMQQPTSTVLSGLSRL
jgi:hypothetical protein